MADNHHFDVTKAVIPPYHIMPIVTNADRLLPLSTGQLCSQRLPRVLRGCRLLANKLPLLKWVANLRISLAHHAPFRA